MKSGGVLTCEMGWEEIRWGEKRSAGRWTWNRHVVSQVGGNGSGGLSSALMHLGKHLGMEASFGGQGRQKNVRVPPAMLCHLQCCVSCNAVPPAMLRVPPAMLCDFVQFMACSPAAKACALLACACPSQASLL